MFEICTQVEIPDGNLICPDRSRQKVSMSRLSQAVSGGKYLCTDFRAFMFRVSCLYQNFVRSCPEFCAFTRTFVRPYPDFPALTRHSCLLTFFVRSCPDFCALTRLLCLHRFLCVPVQTFVVSPNYCVFAYFFELMTRLFCVQQTNLVFMTKLHVQTHIPSWVHLSLDILIFPLEPQPGQFVFSLLLVFVIACYTESFSWHESETSHKPFTINCNKLNERTILPKSPKW